MPAAGLHCWLRFQLAPPQHSGAYGAQFRAGALRRRERAAQRAAAGKQVGGRFFSLGFPAQNANRLEIVAPAARTTRSAPGDIEDHHGVEDPRSTMDDRSGKSEPTS